MIWKLPFIEFRVELIMPILHKDKIVKTMIISAYGICGLIVILAVIDFETNLNNSMIMAMIHAARMERLSYETFVMSLPLVSLIPLIITTDFARKKYFSR